MDIFISSLELKLSDSTCAKARKHACHLLGSAINDLNQNTTDPATPLSFPIDNLEARAILWHLSELNFRFELLALHKRAGTPGRDAVDFDQDVRSALQLASLQAVDMFSSVEGIHSTDLQSCLLPLLWLATLMRVRAGDKPLPILHC
jgi:hypothetical protein